MYAVYRNQPSLLDYVKDHKTPATLVLAFGLMTAAAAIALAFRRQEALLGSGYPASIRKAITHNLVEGSFWRRDLSYRLTFLSTDANSTHVRIELNYVLHNRTSFTSTTVAVLTPMRPSVRYTTVKVDGRDLDANNASFRTKAGMQVPVEVKGNSSVPISLVAEVDYWRSDSDLFASYLPASRMTLTIVNKRPPNRRLRRSLEPRSSRSDGTRPDLGLGNALRRSSLPRVQS